jgi:hypothetical protein
VLLRGAQAGAALTLLKVATLAHAVLDDFFADLDRAAIFREMLFEIRIVGFQFQRVVVESKSGAQPRAGPEVNLFAEGHRLSVKPDVLPVDAAGLP